jgi:hypothetical protein
MAPQTPQKDASPATDERPAEQMADGMEGVKPEFEEDERTHGKHGFLCGEGAR